MDNKPILGWVVLALVIGLASGYYVGNSRGFKQAEGNLKKIQEEAAAKAANEAAKAANPFQAVNPLEGVQSNPFEKTKSILNPFK